MMQSSIPLAMGMLDAPFTSSAPSATNHFALLFRPHSLSSVERRTPVHSEQLVIPCVSCTVFCLPLWRLPAHSMKCTRVTDGKRRKSSMLSVSGRSTSPCIVSECVLGSTSGRKEPRVVAMSCNDDGAITPTESCNGEARWNTLPNTSGDGLPPIGCCTRTEVTYLE